MLTLRLTQFTEAEDKYRVEVALEGDGQPRQTATSRFDFKLSAQDHEDLRWYLEDYLQYPLDPAPTIAARIEQRMNETYGNLAAEDVQKAQRLIAKIEQAMQLWSYPCGALWRARICCLNSRPQAVKTTSFIWTSRLI